MSFEWKQVRLGDFIDSCLGKMLDQKKNRGTFHPYLGNSNVRWGEFDLSNLSEMKFEDTEHERYSLKKGDLVVCEGGEPGRCAIWDDEIPGMKIQKALHRIRTLPGLTSGYLYYWFLFSGKKGTLEPYFTGTTIKHLTGRSLADLTIRLPPVKYQEKCALILSSIDCKINHNKKVNQTLEQIAQALFKSWFVDFEPVKAKMAVLEVGGSQGDATLAAMTAISGKDADALVVFEREYPQQYAELKATAELFPSEMQESELGEIPSGWYIDSIKNICEVVDYVANGSFAALKENVNIYDVPNDVLYIRTTDFNNEFSKGLKYTDAKSYDFLKKSSLVGNEVIISNVGDVGTVFRPPSWLGLPMTLASNAVAIKSDMFNEFLHLYFKSYLGQHAISSIVTGSAQLKFNKTSFRALKITLPPENLLLSFNNKVIDIVNLSNSLNAEKYALTQLRDTLLPKLLSCEITLLEAEQTVSEVENV